MRVIHRGYAATTYGEDHLTVSDRSGKIVYEDHSSKTYTEIELKLLIEAIIDGKRGD